MTASRATFALLWVLATSLALGGCATLERGVLDDVAVVTDPPGATVSASSGSICTSPCAVSGPRRDGITITIVKPGYVTQTVTAESKPTDRLTIESKNEVTADYLGRVIDVQDGSDDEHVPNAFAVKLVPDK